MKLKVDSRSPMINTEECVRRAGGGRYDLVLIASQRLRELKRQHREDNKFVTAVDALLEVQNGQLDLSDYLAKVK